MNLSKAEKHWLTTLALSLKAPLDLNRFYRKHSIIQRPAWEWWITSIPIIGFIYGEARWFQVWKRIPWLDVNEAE